MDLIRLQSGLQRVDEALGGGLFGGEITLIYGEPGTGKTSLTLRITLNGCIQGLKTLYFYTDGLFPYPKLEILTRRLGIHLEKVHLDVMHLNYFNDVERVVREVELGLYDEYDILAFDTYTGPYRSIPVREKQTIIKHNKKLNQLTAILKSYVLNTNKHIVLTSRLKSPGITEESLFDEPIASNVLTYWSDNIILLARSELPLQRRVVLQKAHGLEVNFEIQAQMIGGCIEEV
ncbi:MAG: hypothetical protein N3F04_03065 [Candidatus Nezhaarchaeota archaeon]|nr:hypothetical protein [Candidatus Nezhaarchaeota archaeon]MCX8141749.1 hypothetical protein [Candidatus Nezhaarchaeota archaeon]MDW8050473.1 ATPase domain-containing protein [Nitrososphaerota archaeon]